MTSNTYDVEVHNTLADIDPALWDACANPDGGDVPLDPFTTHRFLLALEKSGSVGPGTGWQPFYLTVQHRGGTIAVAPLYAKSHSQGEYIFDHNWAQAYENAGGRYYPKLQMAVPFTPATGRRLLTRTGFETDGQAALIEAAKDLALKNGLSSLHVTFCTDAECQEAQTLGLMGRNSQQFHWENAGYDDFDGFLASLSSRKRKTIRRERAGAQGFGGTIHALQGDAIEPSHWEAFWQFYQDTGARKWGIPYLTRAFFDEVQAHLRDDVLLMMAERDGRWVAGALNFIGRDTLYGRYWGCVENHPFLHFEMCYYTAIDYAITHGLARVEAGAQGEHKLARGYMPMKTRSMHWFQDAQFGEAVAKYLDAEEKAIDDDIEILTQYGPFRKSAPKEFE